MRSKLLFLITVVGLTYSSLVAQEDPKIIFNDFQKSLTSPAFTPPIESNSSGAFTYASSNTDVATVSGTIITIVGVGETTITATQEATDRHNASTISANLTVHSNHAWTASLLGAEIDGEGANDHSGSAVSLSSDGTVLAIGAKFNDGDGAGIDSGHVRVYAYNEGSWSQRGSDINGEGAGDEEGWAISLSSDGTILAIGANRNSDVNGEKSGQVRVYAYNGSDWSQLGTDIDGEAEEDQSGRVVSLSSDGTVLAIGAHLSEGVSGNNNSGQVKVYSYNEVGNVWSQLGTDINGEVTADNFGKTVSLSSDGTVLAIASRLHDGANGEDSGQVKVYAYSGSDWSQLGSNIDGEAALDRSGLGISLSSDGTVVAIGAALNNGNGDDSGHVRVYAYNEDVWSQLGSDIDGEAEGDQSGIAVSYKYNKCNDYSY